MEKYATLKNQYADFLSLEEFSRVCKISKKSARYLVEHNIIPAIDTGQQTWRYKIDINDVITYLGRRDEVGSMIPPGAVSSHRKGGANPEYGYRKSFSQMVAPGQEHEVAEYFNFIYADCKSVLTTVEVAEMTGLNRSTILKLAQSGQIKSISSSPKYLIPKQYLLEFVVTRRFLESKSKSELFKNILGGFEIWKTAKLSQ